jgi:ADP-ribose pyrophosphatase YjhB (NUDIX family)
MSLLPKREPLDEEFRAVGMTGSARNYPRSVQQIRMFAAWLGIEPEKMPDAMKYFANAQMKKSWEAAADAILTFHNWNPPTINVGLLWVGDEFSGGVLVGRRAIPGFGFGKLALIGGFQDMGETPQEAVNREFFEETGLQLDVTRWETHGGPISVENGTKNIQFWYYKFLYTDNRSTRLSNDIDLSGFVPNSEISEIKVWQPKSGPDNVAHIELNDDWAFQSHLEKAHHYFFATLR